MSLPSCSVLLLTDIRAGGEEEEEEEEAEEPAAAAPNVRAVITMWQININACLFLVCEFCCHGTFEKFAALFSVKLLESN